MALRSDAVAQDLLELAADMEPVAIGESHRKRRTFESAFDPQWIEESRALYDIAGVHVGLEDIAHPGEGTMAATLEHIARCHMVYGQRDDLIHVNELADVDRGIAENKPCSIWHAADAGAYGEVDDPLRSLDIIFGLGVRMFQLTYLQTNRLCSSWLQGDDGTGLTDDGRAVVKRLNELGGMVDIAHCGDQSAMDIVEASDEPVMISHTACRSIYDDTADPAYLNAVLEQPFGKAIPRPEKTGNRNASDEIIKAVAGRGGIIGFYVLGILLGQDPAPFDLWFRHLEHAIDVAGVDHVGVGSDISFFPAWTPMPMDWANWPYWTVGLVCRGLSDDDIRKIIGGNYMRHLRQVLDKQPWGEFIP
jgi:membrane dipeptidase